MGDQSATPMTNIQQHRSEKVVISGISGRLPESDNIEEFRQHLIDEEDMVTEDDRRWPPGHFGLPRRHGKLKDLTKFDASYFGVHPKQANVMDPQLRLLLEVTHEAIIDSGTNLHTLRGSKTAVFIGCIGSECHEAWTKDPDKVTGYEIIGCSRAMFANRISFFFDFKGPSYVIDSACSSSFFALNEALQSIREGRCDSAVVGGCNLCLAPTTSMQFQMLNMLSPDGACKSFDSGGNGYCRSEGIMCVFLQREKSAKRIYASIVHSSANCDGNKEKGVTYPSGDIQKRLLKTVYAEAGVDPAQVSYVEAHGTGTPAGDLEELNSITEVFCTADRQGPLLIGSTKSNMGHPEPVAGLAALAKVIIAMEDGAIPANLHYKSPNLNIPGLADGRLSVVSKRTDWEGGYVGINSFGFGGANVHAIVQSNSTPAAPKHAASEKIRLVTLCGRTEEAVKNCLEKISNHPTNVELQSLLQMNSDAGGHPYRGYRLLNHDEDVQEIRKSAGEGRPVWYVFSGMGSQWVGMGRDLMNIDTFQTSIMRSCEVLNKYNINLYDMLMKEDGNIYDSALNSFVSIVSIQVALVDVLTELGIQPDGLVGHSVGELGCAYADGGLTAEEAILAAYWRGRCIKEANIPPGAMAAVGMTWDEAKRRCPEEVVAACHNSEDTVTISGPREKVNMFVEQLHSENIFAKNVNSAGVAFHSPWIVNVAPALKAALLKVIKDPKPRSAKWISSSIPADRWNENLAKTCSAEYHVNNLVSPVLFQEALQHIPKNAITIEIAPHCLLQSILKSSLSPNCTFVGLMKRNHQDNLEFLLSSLGKLYIAGVNFDSLALFAPVKFPVSPGTPNLASFVQWDHAHSWNVPTLDMFYSTGSGGSSSCVFEVDTNNPDDQYLDGHIVDDRVLFPATGYMQFAWKALAKITGQGYEQMPVAFENVHIHRATLLYKTGAVKFFVTITPQTGQFEISESGGLVCNGRIFVLDRPVADAQAHDKKSSYAEDNLLQLNNNDIYKVLRLCGFQYTGMFQGILSGTSKCDEGYLAWAGNWVTFVDAMLQMQFMSLPGRKHNLPTRIGSLEIDPRVHQRQVVTVINGQKAIKVVVNRDLDTISSGGVKIIGYHATVAPRRQQSQAPPVIEQQMFIPYSESLNATDELKTYAEACAASASRIVRKMPGCDFENLIQDFDECVETSGALLDALNCIEALNHDDTTVNNIASILEERNGELIDDELLKIGRSERMLKTLIDVVHENYHRGAEIIKIVEYGTTGVFNRVAPFMSTHPQLKVDYTVTGPRIDQLSTEHLQSMNVKSVAWNLHQPLTDVVENADVVILDGSLNLQADLSEALRVIKGLLRPDGFVLIIEPTRHFSIPLVLSDWAFTHMKDLELRSDGPFCNDECWKEIIADAELQVVAEKSDQVLNTLYLCRPVKEVPLQKTVIDVDDLGFQWVEEVKVAMAATEVEEGQRIWLRSKKCTYSGIVGMVNSLRMEDGGTRIRCLFNACGSSHLPELESEEFVEISKKDLVMNVRVNNRWGSFRHVSLSTNNTKTTEYACISALTRGDVSSLKWVESPLKYFDANLQPGKELCQVAYASLNFRDIMLATGKLPRDAIPGDLASQEFILGMEFSGYNTKGESVMGLLPFKGLATVVDAACKFLWPVPESWTLEEAATVPVAYSAAYYALVVRGKIKKGDRVLIHCGSGGVGQAAIAIALDHGCEVFTTVSSQEKKQYLQQRFPLLQDGHFSNSRDCSFREDILRATGGKGVDVVLNSVAGEKLQASVKLLAQHGRFLEIGKFDLANNTSFGMAVFLRNITFHGILVDALFDGDNGDWSTVHQLVEEGIKSHTVVPLKTTIFEKEDVEGAFRFMAQAKHVGKVVVKIQGEEKQPIRIPSIARSTCHPRKTYVIIGGLGGVGFEVADWLVGRGARNVVLTSRSGNRNGYQRRTMAEWRDQGVNAIVVTSNVLVRHGAEDVIDKAQSLGPVGGIFNIAMVLRDGVMKNQTSDNFVKVAEPKVIATIHLDQCSRQMCKESLDWFVVFSSGRSRHGAVGLANYGFANSALERICEQRQKDGFPGIAIQWGAIGDVGVVMDSMGGNEAVVGGTIPQRIRSFLSTLDAFLNTPSTAVVSSRILDDRKKSTASEQSENGSVLVAVTHILGINDTRSLNRDASLSDLGLDSLMSAEVKQTLERDFDILLPMREIRALSFNKMESMTEKNCDSADGTNRPFNDKSQ